MKDFKRCDGKFYINSKEVSEEAYMSMLEEKANNFSIPQLNPNYSPENDIRFSPESQNILDLIDELSNIEPEDAVQKFTDMISKNSRDSYMQGQIDAYTEFGILGHKIATRMEIELEEMQSEDYDEQY